MKEVQGGIAAPAGFKTAGVRCGVKQAEGRKDLALIVPETEAAIAGVFTSNIVKAPCVVLNQERIKSGKARAIVVNAGNANACNGKRGMEDARKMASITAGVLGVPESMVLVASTGVIGKYLPMDRIEAGIREAASGLHAGGGGDAAQAIMTTDTFPKETALEFELGGAKVRIGGMAKGSGMIAPDMATMLAFIATDAAVDRLVLQGMLSRAVKTTFNAITVDGDTSTNDMCLLLANGAAGNPLLTDETGAEAEKFRQALHEVCLRLAKEIARDGEGATKLVEVTVRNSHGAAQIAKTIANSPLVKTALFGNDPNWGRILAAAGRSGVTFDPEGVEITLAGTVVYSRGAPAEFDPSAVSDGMKAKELSIVFDCKETGGETATVYTCDFSYGYVKINADYHT